MKETDTSTKKVDSKLELLNDKLNIILAELDKQKSRREQVDDLMKDLSPVIRQAGLDLIKKLHDLEEKGYFIFLREVLNIPDKIVTHFTVDDLRLFADNIVVILDTVKNLTQPDMLRAINNAMTIYKDLYTEDIKEVSMLKALRMMNSKDGKKAMGFIMTLLMNMAKYAEKNK